MSNTGEEMLRRQSARQPKQPGEANPYLRRFKTSSFGRALAFASGAVRREAMYGHKIHAHCSADTGGNERNIGGHLTAAGGHGIAPVYVWVSPTAVCGVDSSALQKLRLELTTKLAGPVLVENGPPRGPAGLRAAFDIG
ncbi:hypothetical protein ON010_g6740 [Phytophthora cinnamomi]|nr:hypothetical protein ON010_g6740 [Phytophthora cinnamomi]